MFKKFDKIVKKFINKAGLIIGLAVDLIFNGICFSSLSPNLITKISFLAISSLFVLFVSISFTKNSIYFMLFL